MTDSKSSIDKLLFNDTNDTNNTNDTNDTEPKTHATTPLSRPAQKPTIILQQTYKWDTQDNLQTIEDKLASIIRPKLVPYKKKPYTLKVQTKEHVVDITTISTLGIHYNLQAKSSKMFTTSIYKINYVLKE